MYMNVKCHIITPNSTIVRHFKLKDFNLVMKNPKPANHIPIKNDEYKNKKYTLIYSAGASTRKSQKYIQIFGIMWFLAFCALIEIWIRLERNDYEKQHPGELYPISRAAGVTMIYAFIAILVPYGIHFYSRHGILELGRMPNGIIRVVTPRFYNREKEVFLSPQAIRCLNFNSITPQTNEDVADSIRFKIEHNSYHHVMDVDKRQAYLNQHDLEEALRKSVIYQGQNTKRARSFKV